MKKLFVAIMSGLAIIASTIWVKDLEVYTIIIVLIIFSQLLVLENQITNKATVPVGLVMLLLALTGWTKLLLFLQKKNVTWKSFSSKFGDEPHFFILGWLIIAGMQLYIIYFDIYNDVTPPEEEEGY